MAVIVHGPTPTVIHPVSPKTLLNYFFSAQKIKEGREIRTLGFFSTPLSSKSCHYG